MDSKLNADRFTGDQYVNLYNKYRPSPPMGIIQQTLNYLTKNSAETIVDLGCGTGISTRIWSDYANEVIGVEPSEDMMAVAQKLNTKNNIRYIREYANATNIDDQYADIVTCSQSFHWMEPTSTTKEIYRILKPGGVLVIYDTIWPPAINYELESAYTELFHCIEQITNLLDKKIAQKWPKSEHFNNIKKCQLFKFLVERTYHKSETYNKQQFLGIALSQGGLEALVKRGYSEEEIGLSKFKQKIDTAGGLPFNLMTYNYNVIFGIK